MEISFNKIENLLSNPQKLKNYALDQKKKRSCSNPSKEIDLLTKTSVWVHKQNNKNWCFKVTEIPKLLKTRVNPHTGVKFSSSALREMQSIRQTHLDSLAHPDKILELNYLDYKRRMKYIQKLQGGLMRVHKVLKTGKQCVTDSSKKLLDYLNAVKTINAGSFGSVSEGCLPLEKSGGKCVEYPFRFAIKEARIKENSLKTLFNKKDKYWHESIILQDLINPLVKNRVCPNLPLLVDTFTCQSCSMRLHERKYKGACMISILELANGTLRDFLKSAPSEPELWSALFQILAALHAVQFYYQMFHYDIKDVNILYYNVAEGGYFEYTIHGQKFYVPNHGKLFVLSDFGLSHTLHPESDITDYTGLRYSIVMNNKISLIAATPKAKSAFKVRWNGKRVYFVDQYKRGNQVTDGGDLHLTPEQIAYLKSIGAESDPRKARFYNFSEIVPPLEFRYDVQDVLRSFVGGKRTTQHGNHSSSYKLPKTFRATVSKYVDKTAENDFQFKTGSERACFATAGYMIIELFSKWTRAQKGVIDRYDIS